MDPKPGDSLWIPAGWGPEMSCNIFLATACAQAQERARVNAEAARACRWMASDHAHGSRPWAFWTVEFLFAAAFAEYEYAQARDHYAGAFYRLRFYPMAGGEEGGGSMAGVEQGGGSVHVFATTDYAPGEGFTTTTKRMAGGEEGGGFKARSDFDPRCFIVPERQP